MGTVEADRIESLIAAMTGREDRAVDARDGGSRQRPRPSKVGISAIREGRGGIAVEESRLGIPLMFAGDVIHGDRAVFPIPLAEAGTFDPKLWKATARCSATLRAHESRSVAR